MLPPYQNEPFTDFTDPAHRAAFETALAQVKATLGQTYTLVIGGQRISTEHHFASVNPARPAEMIGCFPEGDASHADKAVEAAAEAFKTWRTTSAEARARTLLRAAADIRRRKHQFSALIVLEVGKTWAEADADTAEAIDFLEYYARHMLRLADSSHTLTAYPGEQLGLHYIPLGVGAVIPPWNFPCALPVGMIGASLAAGNTVVFKPAEQSPTVGWWLAEALWNAGLPDGVLNFITGPGHIVGARMVEHPGTRFVAFTGSREVGVQIHETAAKVQPGQIWLKRTILELGGKNAIIVDETADVDAAAEGIVASAFGFQGQKCSACSRAILVDSVYDAVAERVVALTRELSIGAPDEQPSVGLGPVIDRDALDKITRYIDLGHAEGRALLPGGPVETPEGGYFVAPAVFGEVKPDARIAQDEIFGPVLALIRVRDFDEALAVANDTEYGLTGAVYSRNRDRLERARRDFHVGNLYFNRKCTGALVGVNPFGGFNMSGTDSKAGSPDYLLLYSQAKSLAERL